MAIVGSSGPLYFCCHSLFTFIVIYTSILWWDLDISVFISILPLRHIFVISHHRCTIMDVVVSIFARRNYKSPLHIKSNHPYLWPSTARMPHLDIPETLKIGCMTLADRKSLMTFSPVSVLRRTRFTWSVTTLVPSAVRKTTRLAGRIGAPGK